MARNSFKELESYEMRGHEDPSSSVDRGIQENVGLVSYVGNVFELYIPKIFSMFVSFAGGDADKLYTQSRKAPDQMKQNDGTRGV